MTSREKELGLDNLEKRLFMGDSKRLQISR